LEKHFFRRPCASRTTWNSLHQAKSSVFTPLCLEPVMDGVRPINKIPSKHLFYCPYAKYLASF
jgi:hypothetical protein